MKFTVVTVSTASIQSLIRVYKQLNKQHPGVLSLDVFYAARNMPQEKRSAMQRSIISSDAVLIDLMGSPEGVVKDVNEALEKARGNIIPYGRSGREYMRLGDISAKTMNMGNGMGVGLGEKKPSMKAMKKMGNMAEKMGKVMPGKMRDMGNLSQFGKYFSVADEYNIRNMLLLLLRDYGGYTDLPKPNKAREIPEIGICDPEMRTYYDSYNEYAGTYTHDDNKPVVAVLFYGHTYPNDTAPCVAQMCRRIREFANVLPIAFSGPAAGDFGVLSQLLKNAAGKKADIIVNFMSFRLSAGPMGGDAQKAVDVLREADVPYIHPFVMSRRRVSEWEQSCQGINSMEFMLSVMLPEFDGSMESIPVAAMSEPVYDDQFDIDLRDLTLIPGRVDKVISRIQKQLALKNKRNSEKKIAIICYNYPPGEANLFGGSFLDTFASIEKLLVDLKAQGYDVQTKTSDELIEAFTTGGVVNSARYFSNEEAMARYDVEAYINNIKNEPYYKDLIADWGQAPGDVMVGEDGRFLIPGVLLGNVFIGLQPSRGIHEDSDKVYHDKKLTPHHQYLAFYQWISKKFDADAMIHVGTHGTMEFTRGKECGMSDTCFPDIMTADIPHIYLYYSGNPSEAMIAKRRAHANIVSYQPTEYVTGELYGEYVKLSALIEEYREAKLVSPERCKDLLTAIGKAAKENNLPEDIDELEHELLRMDRTLIPKGLHTFGIGYSEDQAASYIRGLLRYDRGEYASLNRIISDDLGFDYDIVLEISDRQTMNRIEDRAGKIFNDFMKTDKINPKLVSDKGNRIRAYDTLHSAKQIMQKSMKNNETAGLMGTLEGRYNMAKLAGDIYRNPEVLPTGYNVYQFDPRYVPSDTAMLRGRRIARNTIDAYREEHGECPKTTAVILWGLETSRTQGETVAQVLSYLGVRKLSSSYVWESRYEIIPTDELKHPRVDVVINICGFFRDMFPNLIDDINKLLGQISQLDEPDEMNNIKANSKKLYEQLKASGMDESVAKELSYARIFGPGEAEYGTNITSIIETKNWADESEIGEAFIDSIKHVYTLNHRGMEAKELYTSNLSSVNLVSQIRSNHEYEVTDLDHYYEFFGGLAKSVEIARGEKVNIYITDTTGERMETETANRSIGRGIRTRLLNPKWIDGMLAHKYHGAQHIADRFENVMGLAATTGEVEEWIYDDMHTTYIEDEQMRRRMKENNPYAFIEIIEQMMEYNARGYWDATDAQLDLLKRVYLDIDGDVEERIENKA